VAVFGSGWTDGELDADDVFAPRVLAGGLLLFEQVLLPLAALEVVLRTLSREVVLSLLKSERLVPVYCEDMPAFFSSDGLLGVPTTYRLVRPDPSLPSALERFVPTVNADKELRECVLSRTKVLPEAVPRRIVAETQKDLQGPALRKLVGLRSRPSDDGSEPVWDAVLVNRLLHLNEALAAGEELQADVIEFEAGLSRLATEKWFTHLRFNRLFSSAEAFDGALRGAGVPDVGLLEARIGLAEIAAISETDLAQEFRDSFWRYVCGREEREQFGETAGRELERAIGIELEDLRLPTKLKLRFFEQSASDYLVGESKFSRRTGFASRAERGTAALQLQSRIQSELRVAELKRRFGAPSPYEPCPCRSGEKHRFCCGRRRGE
jgi:hypothetical protein